MEEEGIFLIKIWPQKEKDYFTNTYSEQSLQDALSEIREGGISILGARANYGVLRPIFRI